MILPLTQKNILNLDEAENINFDQNNLSEEDDFPPRDFDLNYFEPLTELFQIRQLSEEIQIKEKSPNNIKEEYIKEEDIDKIIPPNYFSLKEIKDLIMNKFPPDVIKEFSKSIFLEKNLLEVESSINNPVFLGKKRKKKEKMIKFNENQDKHIAKKNNKDISTRKHDKYHGDNIIKKIKMKLMEGFLRFGNNVINNSLSKAKLFNYNKIIRPLNKNKDKFEDLLKIINYDKIERLQKKKNLSQLYMSFNQLFSNDNISPKYSLLNPNSNKVIIQNILKDENKNENIALVMNMKFKDWIDIFTYKKDFNSILKLEKENSVHFSQFIEYADKLILDIYKKNPNNNYVLYFLVYLYNYERWFTVKRGRNRVSNASKKETI